MNETIEWHYVKDKLPTKDSQVLVTSKYGTVEIMGFWKEKKKFISDHIDYTELIVSWADIPKGCV